MPSALRTTCAGRTTGASAGAIVVVGVATAPGAAAGAVGVGAPAAAGVLPGGKKAPRRAHVRAARWARAVELPSLVAPSADSRARSCGAVGKLKSKCPRGAPAVVGRRWANRLSRSPAQCCPRAVQRARKAEPGRLATSVWPPAGSMVGGAPGAVGSGSCRAWKVANRRSLSSGQRERNSLTSGRRL